MLQIQARIKEFLDERGWTNLTPSDLAKSIMIEGAELLELFQWHNYTAEEINSDAELRSKVKKELADVMIYCTDLAIHLDIDVEEAMSEKLKHNAEKYPADKIRNLKDKDARREFYLRQKVAYRKAGK